MDEPMKVVVSAKVIEVKDRETVLDHYHGMRRVQEWNPHMEISPEDIEITKEYIRGKEFITPKGKRLIIGHSKEISELIGFPIECYEGMSDRISDLMEQVGQLTNEVNRKRTFKERVKILFTGRLDER